ncbi:MAG: hypothetical protein ACYDBB_08740 [Armatimonadota bacterium]
MPKPYANATHVLPSALLKEVQRHFSGRLYVPAPMDEAQRRRALVLVLNERGLDSKEIAARVRLSQRRVQQILQGEARWNASAFSHSADRGSTQRSD